MGGFGLVAIAFLSVALLAPGQDGPTQRQAPMAVDADPSFEVATIQANDSGIPTMLGLGSKGRNFSTTNTSLADLIGFAYGLHAKQVAEVPKEIEHDRWDISGVPDLPGVPNVRQQQAIGRLSEKPLAWLASEYGCDASACF